MIKISVRGLEEVRKKIATLTRDSKKVVEKAVGEYLIGDMRHGLAHYPGYRYVTWKSIGGFVSDKQRKYVMANIREGKIDPGVPHRTGRLQRGWDLVDKGRFYQIINETNYAKYVMGEYDQSRMHGRIGWRTTMEVVKTNLKGAIRSAEAALKRWFRSQR